MNDLHVDGIKAIEDLEKELQEYFKKVDETKVLNALEIGAKILVDKVRKLPKPRSTVSKSGYTHLLDSVNYKKNDKNSISVGWGKYYGPILERGTKKMKAQPHINPTYEANKQLIINKMIETLNL